MNYNVIFSREDFYDETVDSDVKRYKEIRKLTIGQGEDYTKGCLFNYEDIKNHGGLMAVHLSR